MASGPIATLPSEVNLGVRYNDGEAAGREEATMASVMTGKPMTMPMRCGIVRRKPKLAPDAVIMMFVRPGGDRHRHDERQQGQQQVGHASNLGECGEICRRLAGR